MAKFYRVCPEADLKVKDPSRTQEIALNLIHGDNALKNFFDKILDPKLGTFQRSKGMSLLNHCSKSKFKLKKSQSKQIVALLPKEEVRKEEPKQEVAPAPKDEAKKEEAKKEEPSKLKHQKKKQRKKKRSKK